MIGPLLQGRPEDDATLHQRDSPSSRSRLPRVLKTFPAVILRQKSTRPKNRATSPRAYSLVEIVVALTIFGLVMAAVTRQLIKSIEISVATDRVVESARSGRFLLDRLNHDVVNAQAITIYSEFTDRTTPITDTHYGNYVVMHRIDATGVTTRTIGYYLKATAAGGTYALYRHDSQDGVLVPNTLPDAATSGTHRLIVQTVRLPPGTDVKLFRNWNGKGFTLRGQLEAPDGSVGGRLENFQCSLDSRN